ncbi:MAG: hypothetical protein GPJ52_00855 [Candidatus Heimdallarchaeota archaeon]|nr:hypothetical protein [Candidatus Heimdallarchaeota archaeon]
MSRKRIKRTTLISLIVGLFLFLTLFSIPFIIEYTRGIGDSNSTFGESFGIAFACFSISLVAIIYTPMITWLSVGNSKNTERWGYFLCSLILGVIIVSSGLAYPFAKWQVNQDTRNEGAIVILNDRDFKLKYGFTGEGSENEPFLIENLQINTPKIYGIFIRDTTKYFLIQNCTIQSKNSPLYVKNTASGTCKIISNNITSGSIGVEYSNYILVENNTIQSRIDITMCLQAKIIHNKCDFMQITYSDQAIIRNNICSNGLLIASSGYSIVSNNLLSNCIYAGIRLIEVNNLLLVNNTAFSNPNGLVIDSSELVTIINNNFSLNSEFGIIIQYSRNISFSNNFIQKNQNGLFFNNNHFIEISNNLFKNNTEYGIVVEYTGQLNSIYHNNFFYNNLVGMPSGIAQVFENTSLPHFHYQAIYWYDINTSEGNYWTDLVWNEGITYNIDGGNNTDPYPLENSVDL